MALPTWVAAGTFDSGTGGAVPGLPAGWQQNDILVLLVESNFGASPVVDDAGYVHITGSPQSNGATGDTQLAIFWKRAGASESAPTVTGGVNHKAAIVHAIRGCPTTGNPWDVISPGFFTGTSASVTVPGDTTTVADCLVLIAISNSADTTTDQTSAWANTDLANLTERSDDNSIAGGGGGIGVATGEKASAGTYGNTTATLATSTTQAYFTIALKPPAGGATTVVAPAGSASVLSPTGLPRVEVTSVATATAASATPALLMVVGAPPASATASAVAPGYSIAQPAPPAVATASISAPTVSTATTVTVVVPAAIASATVPTPTAEIALAAGAAGATAAALPPILTVVAAPPAAIAQAVLGIGIGSVTVGPLAAVVTASASAPIIGVGVSATIQPLAAVARAVPGIGASTVTVAPLRAVATAVVPAPVVSTGVVVLDFFDQPTPNAITYHGSPTAARYGAPTPNGNSYHGSPSSDQYDQPTPEQVLV